jgi:hypothetical protein
MKTNFEPAIFDADNFLVLDVPKKEKILNPWLTEQSINLISGWRGTGKTWFCLSLFDAISRWQDFGPWQLTNPVGCLYIDGEMTAGDPSGRNPRRQGGSETARGKGSYRVKREPRT